MMTSLWVISTEWKSDWIKVKYCRCVQNEPKGDHLPFSRFLNFLEISSFNLFRVRRPIIESFVPFKISQKSANQRANRIRPWVFYEIFLQNLIFQILFLRRSVWLANKVMLVLNMKKYIHSNHFWLPNLTADESKYFLRITSAVPLKSNASQKVLKTPMVLLSGEF